MERNPAHEQPEIFLKSRQRLTRLAYRMLGSATDAEDIVQEAFLRWVDANPNDVRHAEAYLSRIVTNLCLDYLKSAVRRRESYVGTWLPEPVMDPEEESISKDAVTLPLLMALERLSPLERAAFLLHDVFEHSFDDIAKIIDRKPAACRQLARRARRHIQALPARYPISKKRGLEIAEAFFQASRYGNMERLRALLADDVVTYVDGGGKVSAVEHPVVGIDAVMSLHTSLMPIFAQRMSHLINYGFINGLPGFVTIESDDVWQSTAMEIKDGLIADIYVVRNPDKLNYLRRKLTKSDLIQVRE